MALDPNISLGVRPLEVPNQLAQYGQVQQLLAARDTQQLNALKMQEAQAAMEERNALRRLNPSEPDYEQQLFKVNPQLGIAYRKEAATTAAQEAARKKSEFDLIAARSKFGDELKRNLSANPSNENVIAWGQDAVLQGIYTKDQVDSTVQQLLTLPPDQRASVLARSGASAADLKGPAPSEMVKNYEYAKSQGFKGTLFDYERKLKEAGRAPVQPVAPTITSVVDPTNPNQMITVDARRYQGGGGGSPGVIGVAGKEPGAALRANKTEAGKTQLADDLDNLRTSFERLNEMRAIPSTGRNVVSNLMSAAQASGVGQVLGRAGGTEEQVERDVINSARMRLVNSIKNATGMSAQQLNSNVELQTMLKSISDPGQSVEAALRIIDDIDNAYVKGNGALPKRGQTSAPAGVDMSNPLLKK
jgi:hypothetical protein